MLGEWTDARQVVWRYRQPYTVREVIDLDTWAMMPARLALEVCGQVDGAAVIALCAGLARFVYERQKPGKAPKVVSPARLNDELGLGELLSLYQAMYLAACLPDKLAQELEAFTTIQIKGGCECPRCALEPGKDEPRQTRRAIPCALSGIGATTLNVAKNVAQIESVGMDAPWWLYQAKAISSKVIGRKQRETLKQIEADREKRAVDDKLERAGIKMR